MELAAGMPLGARASPVAQASSRRAMEKESGLVRAAAGPNQTLAKDRIEVTRINEP